MLLLQKWPFWKLFFLGNIDQENIFHDILKPKNAFLTYKNNKFQKFEKLPFFHGLGPKMAILATAFFYAI